MEIENYINKEAFEIYNETGEFPKTVDGGNFNLKWRNTDGWRGFYEARPKKGTGWIKVYDGWVTGEWSDAPEDARGSVVIRKQKRFIKEIKNRGGEVIVICVPTSNVFSIAYDVFVRGLDKKEAIKLAEEILS